MLSTSPFFMLEVGGLVYFRKKKQLYSKQARPKVTLKANPKKNNLDKPPVNLFISHLWKRKIIEFSFIFLRRSGVITVSPFGQPSCHPQILCSRNAAKLVLPSAWSHGHVHPPTHPQKKWVKEAVNVYYLFFDISNL